MLSRHPLSAEYADIEGKAWDNLVRDLGTHGNVTGRKIICHEGKVLDGWQFYRACLAADVRPEFAELPGGLDPAAFVRMANDNRRHETPAQVMARVEARVKRVAASRAEGKSLRTIAEEEGVSDQQVRRDLDKATATGVAVEPTEGQVMGKDKKTRTVKPRKAKQAPPAEVPDLPLGSDADDTGDVAAPAVGPSGVFLPADQAKLAAWRKAAGMASLETWLASLADKAARSAIPPVTHPSVERKYATSPKCTVAGRRCERIGPCCDPCRAVQQERKAKGLSEFVS